MSQTLRSGALIELFPDWPDECFPLYVYYASRNHVPAKVRRFIDFITDTLAAKPYSPRKSAGLRKVS
ncbi:DNA-binding transcriptional LysR family regulator [Bradyrhizobium sp. USDA 4516]